MLITLKNLDGSAVVVNTNNICFITQAADPSSKQPILGASHVSFLNGQAIGIKGSPTDIAKMIDGEPRQ